MKYQALIAVLIALSGCGRSSDGRKDEEPQKAVLESSQEKGLRLSEKALQTLEVASIPSSTKSIHGVLNDSLVHFQDQVGIYRLRDGWYKLIPVKVLESGAARSSVASDELRPGDRVVTHGTALLRVTEMAAFDSGD
jgi:hypothetical protein